MEELVISFMFIWTVFGFFWVIRKLGDFDRRGHWYDYVIMAPCYLLVWIIGLFGSFSETYDRYKENN